LAIGAFPASKEVENEDDDEDDWGSTLYRAKHVCRASMKFGHSGRVFQAKTGAPFPRLLCGPRHLRAATHVGRAFRRCRLKKASRKCPNCRDALPAPKAPLKTQNPKLPGCD
jgi:hypothetical protein